MSIFTLYESNLVYVKKYAETDAKPLFLHKDYLGTIVAITDENGNLVKERHFDAWGNLPHGSMLVLDRGYTSHEHLQEVGLIHMNGRLYDPMLRRFLNADEHIQDPTNTQCYNKYGYVMNNPLMFSDPDGEYAVGVAIAIGALVAVLSYTVTIYARDGSLRHWKLGDAYVSAIYGAFSGAVTFSVGSIFSAAGGTATALATSIKDVAGGAGLAVVQAGAHAVTQGVLSSVQGGDFWSAALSGAFGSLGASAFGAIGGNFAKSTVGTISFGAISGGIGAELSGGNFWQGVVIGGIVAGLNHAMHNVLDEGPEGEGPKPKAKSKESKGGKSISVGASGALGGGIGYEIGIVTDSEGGRAFFFSFKGHVGWGGDVGISFTDIKPTHNGRFSVNDFSGTGNSHSASLGSWGYERGGTTGSNTGKYKLYRMGVYGRGNERAYISNGSSRSLRELPTKFGLSYFFTESKTWTFKF